MNRSLASKIRAANLALIVNGKSSALEEFFAADYVLHLTDRDMNGHDWIRGFLGRLRGAFPDLQVEVEVFVEEKNRVAWQRTLKGIHRGDFMGFPASGRQVMWRDMITSRFRYGRIVEEWAVSDLAERMLHARKP